MLEDSILFEPINDLYDVYLSPTDEEPCQDIEWDHLPIEVHGGENFRAYAQIGTGEYFWISYSDLQPVDYEALEGEARQLADEILESQMAKPVRERRSRRREYHAEYERIPPGEYNEGAPVRAPYTEDEAAMQEALQHAVAEACYNIGPDRFDAMSFPRKQKCAEAASSLMLAYIKPAMVGPAYKWLAQYAEEGGWAWSATTLPDHIKKWIDLGLPGYDDSVDDVNPDLEAEKQEFAEIKREREEKLKGG